MHLSYNYCGDWCDCSCDISLICDVVAERSKLSSIQDVVATYL